MRIDAAVIGGTGIGERLLALGGAPVHVPTPLGMVRGRWVEMEGRAVMVASRHSAGHRVPPHRVRFGALALAMRALGARAVFSTAAVGSLRADWPRGTFAVPDDFLDVTARNATLFDDRVVHTDFSEPFAESARQGLLHGAEAAGVPVHPAGVYVCGNGPRYETPFEIDLYRKAGGDIVGMTAATEAILMREAGVPYACLCVVTNLAAGMESEPLDHEDVVQEMDRAGDQAVRVLAEAVKGLGP